MKIIKPFIEKIKKKKQRTQNGEGPIETPSTYFNKNKILNIILFYFHIMPEPNANL